MKAAQWPLKQRELHPLTPLQRVRLIQQWAGCKEHERSKTDQQLERVDTYPLKPVQVDQIFILLFDKKQQQWSLGSIRLRTAFDLFKECNGTGGKKRNANEMGGPGPRSYLISINGFTGDPRDPRKSLRGGFS